MIIPLVEVNWTNVWMETGIGFGIVFVILILIVFILTLFGVISKKVEQKSEVTSLPVSTAATADASSASDDDQAAIATALYLYYQNVHDVESGVITIKHNPYSAWHHELNKHL